MTPIKQQDLIDRGFIQTDFEYDGNFEKENKDLQIGLQVDYEYVKLIDAIRYVKIYDTLCGDIVTICDVEDMSLEDLDHLIRILKL